MIRPRLLAGSLFFFTAGCGGSSTQPPPPLSLQTVTVPSAVPVASVVAAPVVEVPAPVCAGLRRIGNVSFSPDGQSLVTACTSGNRECSDGSTSNAFVDVWSVPQGKLLRSLATGMENIVTMLWGAGGWLATVANPSTGMCDVRLFNASTWNQQASADVYCVWGIDFNPLGSSLAIAGCDGEVKSLDTKSGKIADRPTAEAHMGGDYRVGVRFSGDGKALFVDDEYAGFQVLDPATLKRQKTLLGEGRVQCSELSPDKSKFAVVNETSGLRVLETKGTGRPLALAKRPGISCSSLEWLDSKRFVVTFESGEVAVWDTSGKGSARTLSAKEPQILNNVKAAPGGGSVAAVDRDGTIFVWDLASGGKRELHRRSSAPSNGAEVLESMHIQWSPSGDRLAGIAAGKLVVWDVRSGQKTLETTLSEAIVDPTIEWSTNAGILALSDGIARLVRVSDGAALTLAVVERSGARLGLTGTDSGAYEGPPELASCVVPDKVPASKRAQRPGLLADFFGGRPLAQSP